MNDEPRVEPRRSRRRRARRPRDWRLKELSILFATIISGAAVLTLLFRVVAYGGNWANVWMDGRAQIVAQKVVSDSLYKHRKYGGHDRRRRR